jgi:hypothetical protein
MLAPKHPQVLCLLTGSLSLGQSRWFAWTAGPAEMIRAVRTELERLFQTDVLNLSFVRVFRPKRDTDFDKASM